MSVSFVAVSFVSVALCLSFKSVSFVSVSFVSVSFVSVSFVCAQPHRATSGDIIIFTVSTLGVHRSHEMSH